MNTVSIFYNSIIASLNWTTSYIEKWLPLTSVFTVENLELSYKTNAWEFKGLLIQWGKRIWSPAGVFPLTKNWSVYHFNGGFILSVSQNNKKIQKNAFKKVIDLRFN